MISSTTKQLFLENLERDISLHESGDFDELKTNSGLDRFETTQHDPIPLPDEGVHPFMIALAFWDSWLDECNHDFPGRYAGIDKDTWPILARTLAEKLALEKEISDPLILEHFRFEPGPSLLDRFKSYFRK